MRIAHLSAEVAPFAKSGGLGDVVGALPRAQADLGHEVSVWMPLYRQVKQKFAELHIEPHVALEPFVVTVGPHRFEIGVLRATLPGSTVPVFFIGSDENFERDSIYSLDRYGRDDGIVRFATFVRAALSALERLWLAPDILHAHDWHAALATMALAWDQPRNWVFDRTRTVVTIHNLAYQGVYAPSSFGVLGLPPAYYSWVEWNGAVNLLKGALASVDAITAVSPTFAREITTPAGGFGLDPMLRTRSRDLHGILNGIDPEEWNPAADPHLVSHYDAADLSGKRHARKSLLEFAGMDPDDDGFLIGSVGRLTSQKGWDLIFPALDELIARGNRFIFLGSGEPHYESRLRELSHQGRGRTFAWIGFREDLAHRIEAGIDSFLMPSLFEPCGLNQMYSLRYGTPPIVRRTGGLADSVVPYDGHNLDHATGFGFDAASPSALRDTVLWAQQVHRNRTTWERLMRNGMAQDFSWQRAAEQYIAVYQSL